MRLVKIGVASVSVKIGDFAGNAARLVEVVAQLVQRTCTDDR